MVLWSTFASDYVATYNFKHYKQGRGQIFFLRVIEWTSINIETTYDTT